jgi:hypothetical protein
MWMGIKAWDHKKQTQIMSRVILIEAKDRYNPGRMHCTGKEFFPTFLAPTTNQSSKQRAPAEAPHSHNPRQLPQIRH